MNYINFNGKLLPADEANLPADSSLLRFGYGLFETMLCKEGTLQLADMHYNRLWQGIQTLEMQVPKHFDAPYLYRQILDTVSRNGLEKLCRVRVQFSGGGGGIFDFNRTLSFMVECFSLNESILELNENGLICGLAKGLEKSPNALAALKTNNALIYALAAQQAKQAKWNDALILNTHSQIIESCIANIFWIKEEQVFTPPLSSGCIAGVMRQFIINRLNEAGVPVQEKILTVAELQLAHEVFLCNSLRRIKWIKSIEDIGDYGNHFIKSLAQKLYT